MAKAKDKARWESSALKKKQIRIIDKTKKVRFSAYVPGETDPGEQ